MIQTTRDKTVEEIHWRLYDLIPAFECLPGCMDCCGPVPFSRWEWERVEDKRKLTSLTCPYAVSGRCEIYEQRPLMCRLFGAVDDDRLRCPHGCGPAVKLTRAEAEQVVGAYCAAIKMK